MTCCALKLFRSCALNDHPFSELGNLSIFFSLRRNDTFKGFLCWSFIFYIAHGEPDHLKENAAIRRFLEAFGLSQEQCTHFYQTNFVPFLDKVPLSVLPSFQTKLLTISFLGCRTRSPRTWRYQRKTNSTTTCGGLMSFALREFPSLLTLWIQGRSWLSSLVPFFPPLSFLLSPSFFPSFLFFSTFFSFLPLFSPFLSLRLLFNHVFL